MARRSILDCPDLLRDRSWDDVEDALLHEYFSSVSNARPRWSYGRFDIASMSDCEVRQQFRFERNDIGRLASALRLPASLPTAQGITIERDEALCITLRRLAYPIRLCDMERMFGRHESTVSLCVNAVFRHITEEFGALLQQLKFNKWLSLDCLQGLSNVSLMFPTICTAFTDIRR